MDKYQMCMINAKDLGNTSSKRGNSQQKTRLKAIEPTRIVSNHQSTPQFASQNYNKREFKTNKLDTKPRWSLQQFPLLNSKPVGTEIKRQELEIASIKLLKYLTIY